jgi:O-antigen ligase
MFCGLGISCLIFDLYNKPSKWWTIFKLAILAYTLIVTKSRSSLVGLLLIIFFHIRNTNNKKLEIAVYIGVIALLPLAVQNLVMRKGGIDDILSMTGRMPFWQALITEALPKEPLLGYGFMRIYYEETFQGLHTYRAHMTHNTFIQVLMNLGFIGFTLVCLQMFFTVKGFLKENKEKKLMLMGILIPIVINSFTEFGIFGETNYGILFYQLLIFLISTQVNLNLNPLQKLYLKRKRPDWTFF